MNVLFKVAGIGILVASVGVGMFCLVAGQNLHLGVAAGLSRVHVLGLGADQVAVGVVAARLSAMGVFLLGAGEHLARLVAGVGVGVLLLAAHERARDAGVGVDVLGLAAEGLVGHGDARELERPRHHKGHHKREARKDGEDTAARRVVMENLLQVANRSPGNRPARRLHVFTSFRLQHGLTDIRQRLEGPHA